MANKVLLVGAMLVAVGAVFIPWSLAKYAPDHFPLAPAFALLLLVAAWLLVPDAHRANGPRPSPPLRPMSALRSQLPTAAVVLTLASFCFAAFFVPMSLAFWHGADDPRVLTAITSPDHGLSVGAAQNRPMLLAAAFLGGLLTPTSVLGVLTISWLSELVAAIALMYLLWLLYPRLPSLGLSAAILFVAAPVDSLRFDVITISNYYFARGLAIAAVALLLHSYKAASRPLLLAACTLLSIAILTLEPVYIVGAIGVALMLTRERAYHCKEWILFWSGTLVVFAVCLILYFVTNLNGYQIGLASTGNGSNSFVLTTVDHVRATMGFLSPIRLLKSTLPTAAPAALVAGSLALIAILWSGLVGFGGHKWRSLVVGTLMSGVAIVLTLLPYAPIAGLTRTELFAAPAQASFWAFVIHLLASGVARLGRVAQASFVASITALIATAAIVLSFSTQQVQAGRDPQFEKMAYILQQISDRAPAVKKDTVFLLLTPEGQPSPLSIVNYSVTFLSTLTLGVPAYLANHPEGGMQKVQCQQGGCSIFHLDQQWLFVPYSRLMVWKIDGLGDTSLEVTFPPELAPPGGEATGYEPGSLALAGPRFQVPFIHPLPWQTPYDVRDRAVLGPGWYQAEVVGDLRFNWGRTGAEIDLGPSLSTEYFLDLELGPSARQTDANLVVTDYEGRVRASTPLSGRTTVRVSFPEGVQPFERLLLRIDGRRPVPGDQRLLSFRLFDHGWLDQRGGRVANASPG